MIAPRGDAATRPALAGATALTAWTAMLAWRGFSVDPGTYLAPLLLTAGLVAGTGIALRAWRGSALVVVLGQTVVVSAFVALTLTGSPLPLGQRWDVLVDGLRAAATSAQTYAAPVPLSADSLQPLLLPLGAVCLLLVDLVACTWRRIPVAGLVLLAIYSVPVSVLDGGVPWWTFAATAGGFLTMLFLHEDEQVSRWGRQLGQSEQSADPSAFGVRTGSARAGALAVGGVATALAVVLPTVIPTLQVGLLGGGSGTGDGEIRVENPMADLRRDLQRGEDVPLLRITTDDPDPSYLRISALTRFTSNEWSSGSRQIPADQQAQGPLPPLVGVSGSVPRQEFDYQVTALDDFDSRWLPTASQVSQVEAAGDWRYDRDVRDFLAADDVTSTRGLSYQLTSVRLDLDAGTLAAAPPPVGPVAELSELPDDVPTSVHELAATVTAEQSSRYERAVALQDWFRTDGGFSYSLETAEGNGSDALVSFLDERVGYCEQFASAMAVMARSLGIPARVSVGFLRPQQVGARTWEYSAWDLHAWPELYFAGSGWVRFEPTPAARADGVPPYTRQEVTAPPSDAAGNPSATGPAEDLPARGGESPAVDPEATAGADRDPGAGPTWRSALGALGLALAAGALALVPRSLRRARRARRWSAGDPESAWAELRDTVIDLHLPWPTGRSPRATAALVAPGFGRPVARSSPVRPAHGTEVAPGAVAALERIVTAVEVSRYARPGRASSTSLRADVETCTQALLGGVTGTTRRRATWLPRSVLRRVHRSAPAVSDAVVDQVR